MKLLRHPLILVSLLLGLVLSACGDSAGELGAQAAQARLDAKQSLQVSTPGFTDRYISTFGNAVTTETITDSSPQDVRQKATLSIVAGLADPECYSVLAEYNGDAYLRHKNSRVYADFDDDTELFKNDATWCPRDGLSGTGISLESKNFPGRYLRHYDAQLWMAQKGGPLASDNAESFEDDASFNIVDPWLPDDEPVEPPLPDPNPPTDPEPNPPTDPSPANPPNPDGRGADVPWTEYQAEDADTNATVIGPSRQKWDANFIEAEAIGRKAVRLDNTGDYVTFTTTAPANSLVVRFSIPDAPGGGGIDATLGLYINGERVEDLQLTSRYAWSYKGGLIGDPIVDIPAEDPHTFFDEARILLDDIPAGSTVTLQRDAQDAADFYVIDLIDLEQVAAPLEMPAGFTSVTEFGIEPNSGENEADRVLEAMRSGQDLYFPAGDYLFESIAGGNVGLDNPGIEMRGAGMWHTNFRGPKTIFFCAGANTSCTFGDFSIFGESYARAEESQGVQKAFAGPMGENSLIENVWIEHVVGAIWVGNDPPYQEEPTDNLTIRDCRIRNVYADGINFDNGTSNSTAENCHMRNLGDDAAVVWSLKWTDYVRERFPGGVQAPDQGQATGNTFRNITVQMPWRANCFAAYGGADNLFEDNICEDVLTYPGILINNEFSPYDFGPGLTTFRNITLERAGGPMFQEDTANPWEHGALKFYMREGDVNDILVENIDIIAPTYAGIEFRGFGTEFVPPGETFHPDILRDADNASFSNVTLRNITITDAGTYGIELNDNAGRGQVSFENVTVSGSELGAVDVDGAPASFFDLLGGNEGWSP